MRDVTVTDDLAVLAVVVGGAALCWLVVVLARAAVRLRTPALPALPAEDRAPAGLGRLVPEGAQLVREVHRGTVALELWLVATARRRTSSAGHPARLPRQRSAPHLDPAVAREAG